MDENRIHEFYDHDDNIVKFVTHADYKALEDEIAALRGKVRELVEADQAFDAARDDYTSAKNGDQFWDAQVAHTNAAQRRRLALEALS